MNLKDRGSIKWTAMMLPKHKTMLSELYQEQEHMAKPQLDEQKYAEINTILSFALAEGKKIKLTYHKKHALHSLTGYIKKYDDLAQEVIILDGLSHLQTVIITNITDIESI